MIFRSHKSQDHLHKRQLYIPKHLKQKLPSNNMIIVPADKGKTIVIDNTIYNELIHNCWKKFISMQQVSCTKKKCCACVCIYTFICTKVCIQHSSSKDDESQQLQVTGV
jgi:hypothetical protein